MGGKAGVLLVGINGYGMTYLRPLLEKRTATPARICGVADPYAGRSEFLPMLKGAGVPVFDAMEDFYAGHSADLAIISSPIAHHCPQTVAALSNGSGVLCEKPLGATVQEGRRMLEARGDRWLGIGYQWSFSPEIQALKKDILAGDFGAPVRLRTMVLWPRARSYYGRAPWAGRIKDDAGNWVLDSPVNNATAHYLHNMLYVLGDAVDTSAQPSEVTAELYRANDIENYDTGAIRVRTASGVEIMHLATHATRTPAGPVFEYEFEGAAVSYGEHGGQLRATMSGGETRDYGNPNNHVLTKLEDALAAAVEFLPPKCGVEAALPQTVCMNAAQESAPGVTGFPEELIVRGDPAAGGEAVTWVKGLGETLQQCYGEWKLPSETGAAWAAAGRTIDTASYTEYPGRQA
ncbi:MAG: Gfo/Idh/MocA family oxidoreductase [Planctomycetes bacterium]|nr:Gfo/Idh/MocA family oxidoreductase [Planctomycetota bacterium]